MERRVWIDMTGRKIVVSEIVNDRWETGKIGFRSPRKAREYVDGLVACGSRLGNPSIYVKLVERADDEQVTKR